MAEAIMNGADFWTGTETSSLFARRGTKLKAVRDRLNEHKGDRAKWDGGELEALANTVAIYAQAKGWKGTGAIGHRDSGSPGIITKLVGQVDAHLRELKLKTIRARLGLVDTTAPAPAHRPPPPVHRAPPPPPRDQAPGPNPALPSARPQVGTGPRPPAYPPPIGRPGPPAMARTGAVQATNQPVAQRTAAMGGRTGAPPPPPRQAVAPARPAPAPVLLIHASAAAPTSTDAIEKGRKELELAKGYASRDAATFFQCIKGYQVGDPKRPNPADPRLHKAPYPEIYQRAAKSGGGDAGAAALGGEFQARLARQLKKAEGIEATDDPFAWNANRVKATYEKVNSASAGECTSFGIYAAHILANTEASTSPRVELVAWETQGPKGLVTHVYCIVNRHGDYVQETTAAGLKRYRLPAPEKWKGEWWIVDPWAGAMGWEVIYEKAARYPYVSMMQPLFLQMVYDD